MRLVLGAKTARLSRTCSLFRRCLLTVLLAVYSRPRPRVSRTSDSMASARLVEAVTARDVAEAARLLDGAPAADPNSTDRYDTPVLLTFGASPNPPPVDQVGGGGGGGKRRLGVDAFGLLLLLGAAPYP